MVHFKVGSNKPRAQRALATLADDEEQQQEVNLPYTEVNLDGDVSSTSQEDSSGGSSSNILSPGTHVEKPVMGRRLTAVSKKYDRDGKGYLNETEQALRRMDSSNKGFLDQDKVYSIMDGLLAEQKINTELMQTIRAEYKKNTSLRRGLIGVGCFAVLLAVANIGTSFVAVKLVKDMEVNQANNDLTNLNGQRVATTSKQVEFTFDEITDTPERRRRLQGMQNVACGASENGSNCRLKGVMTYRKNTQIYKQFCPDWPNADNKCLGEGVERLNINCNGVRATIKGGMYLPPDGPGVFDGWHMFPSVNGNYVVEELVYPADNRSPSAACLLKYQLNVVCPADNKECGWFADFNMNDCPDMDYEKYPWNCVYDGTTA